MQSMPRTPAAETQRPESPPALTPLAVRVADVAGPWHVAHCKSRMEKALAWDLHRRGIRYYLPMYQVERRSGRMRYVVDALLFPSYVAFAGDAAVAAEVYGTGRVCRNIPIVDQRRFCADLDRLERTLAANPRIDPCPHAVPGTRFRVRTGAFEGTCGVVVSRGRDQLIILEIEGLGRALLTIDGADVEPL